MRLVAGLAEGTNQGTETVTGTARCVHPAGPGEGPGAWPGQRAPAASSAENGHHGQSWAQTDSRESERDWTKMASKYWVACCLIERCRFDRTLFGLSVPCLSSLLCFHRILLCSHSSSQLGQHGRFRHERQARRVTRVLDPRAARKQVPTSLSPDRIGFLTAAQTGSTSSVSIDRRHLSAPLGWDQLPTCSARLGSARLRSAHTLQLHAFAAIAPRAHTPPPCSAAAASTASDRRTWNRGKARRATPQQCSPVSV